MSNVVLKPSEDSRNAYAAYAFALRSMVRDLRTLGNPDVDAILRKWNVQEFDAEGILRLGIRIPIGSSEEANFREYWVGRGGAV